MTDVPVSWDKREKGPIGGCFDGTRSQVTEGNDTSATIGKDKEAFKRRLSFSSLSRLDHGLNPSKQPC